MVNARTRGQGFVTASDGLPALEVAAHTKEKEFVIERIVGIFNTGMQKHWDRRYYVDPFAGPGVCRIKETVAEIDGSPIIAAKSKFKFTDYFLGDRNADCLTALTQRIDNLLSPQENKVNYYQNDADTAVSRMLPELPPATSSLGLAVFDPWGWDFSFETIAELTEARRIDLVINFPIGYIKRNWEKELPQLDKFMNGDTYRRPFRAAMRRENPGETPARALLDAYAEELQKIGYNFVRDNVFVENSRRVMLYGLLFASKHSRGADFWDKVTKRTESGQLRMLS